MAVTRFPPLARLLQQGPDSVLMRGVTCDEYVQWRGARRGTPPSDP